jgi:hypothetical protein
MSKIIIAGGSGLLGMRLSYMLHERGHDIVHLSREPMQDKGYQTFGWNPTADFLDETPLSYTNYIINLAGAGVADRHWTVSRKKLIIQSRVDSALVFKKRIAEGKIPNLKAYISASAIGFYGNRGDELLSEEDTSGMTGFLPESVKAWENAIAEVQKTGIRTIAIRIGVVLSSKGGALPKMMMPLRLFSASYFGDGRQWLSWIHIDDLCRIFIKAVEDNEMAGTFNGVSPNPVSNLEFVATLRNAMNKPAILMPVPAFLLRSTMGEMADIVLDSSRVSSKKIERSGYVFHYPELLPALHDILRRKI